MLTPIDQPLDKLEDLTPSEMYVHLHLLILSFEVLSSFYSHPAPTHRRRINSLGVSQASFFVQVPVFVERLFPASIARAGSVAVSAINSLTRRRYSKPDRQTKEQLVQRMESRISPGKLGKCRKRPSCFGAHVLGVYAHKIRRLCFSLFACMYA